MNLRHIKSLLFCPANRTERYEKALATVADCIIFDWEDAVPPAEKEMTRKTFLKWFAAYPNKERIALRINSIQTLEGIHDLAALAQLSVLPSAIILPKTESATEITIIHNILQKITQYVPMIESAKGVFNVEQIAQADTQVSALFVGSADLSSDLGCDNSRDALYYANSVVITAAALSGIACIDSPYFDLEDANGLKKDTKKGKTLGFTARAVIHPKQLAIVTATYTPTKEEISKAKEIIEAAKSGIGIVNGKMVDRAMAKKAQRIVALSQ